MNYDFDIFCWCNSGKKLKECHLTREAQPSISFSERQKTRKKIWNKKYCLHPDVKRSKCAGKIIEAHSVQKSMLKKIAVDSRVYAPSIKTTPESLKILFEKKGVGEVSVFTGFCAYHDKVTFKEIEDENFTGTEEQCFLYGYRAVCKELFLKIAQREDAKYSRTLDAGKPFTFQKATQEFFDDYMSGIEAGVSELKNLKDKFDRILISKNFDEIHNCIFWVDQTPEILCNGIFQLDYDFHGNPLQDWSNVRSELDAISLSFITTSKGGAVILAWHNSADSVCLPVIQSLLATANSNLPNLLVNWVVKELENIFLSPVWWESLPHVNQNIFLEEFMNNPAFMVERNPDYLSTGKIRGFNWNITNITSNVFSVLN